MSNDQLVAMGFELQMRVSLMWSEVLYLRVIDWRGDGGPADHLAISCGLLFKVGGVGFGRSKKLVIG